MLQGIAETERNLVEVVELTVTGRECGLMFVRFIDRHLPVPTLEIESGEPAGIVEVFGARQGMGVLNYGYIKLTEVNTKVQPAILLSYHYHRGCPWAI